VRRAPKSKAVTGGSRCGSVRYSLKALPTFKHICCCRDCQYFTGTDKIFIVGGPRDSFAILRVNLGTTKWLPTGQAPDEMNYSRSQGTLE